jgi:hypothetical protein
MNAMKSIDNLIYKNMRISGNQQHPFHVSGSLKLAVFTVGFISSSVISIVAKLHNVSDTTKFLRFGKEILQPRNLDNSYSFSKL